MNVYEQTDENRVDCVACKVLFGIADHLLTATPTSHEQIGITSSLTTIQKLQAEIITRFLILLIVHRG